MSDDVPDVTLGSVSRRRFLGGVGGGALATALSGCDPRAAALIVPAVRRVPESIPGESIPYATASLRAGQAIGLVVESRDGRPIKIEGHPSHPASLGGTGAIEQALLLGLYDADRLDAIEHRGATRSWRELAAALGPRSERDFARRRGEGLVLWIEPSSSLLLARALDTLRERYPRARVVFDPASAPLARWDGARIAFGRVLEPNVDPSRIDRLIALDADPLGRGPQSLALQRRWAEARRARGRAIRLVVAEPSPTVTGLTADARHAVRGDEIPGILIALLDRFAPAALDGSARERALAPPWLDALAEEIERGRGRVAFVIGDEQPAWAHAAGHALNEALGAHDGAITFVTPSLLEAGEPSYDVGPLLDALDARALDTLITSGVNPAYALPAAARWSERRARAATHVHLAAFRDETALEADWVIPAAHLLERWGDARAFEGTWTLVQPLIEPLTDGRTLEEAIDAILGAPHVAARERLRVLLSSAGHDLQQTLAQGFVEGTAFTPTRAPVDQEAVRAAIARAPRAPTEGWELDVRPDARIEDGRFAENAWLQELPEPVTKLVWGNAAMIAPADAERLGITTGDVVELTSNGTSVRIPALMQPGQAPGVITAWLGFGRRAGGRHARGVGVDVGGLRPFPGVGRGRGSIERTGATRELVTAQPHDDGDQRPEDLDRAVGAAGEPPSVDADPPSFYPPWPEVGVQWGMAIDLDLCTGCSACVVACQAENDIPVVGAEQVARGRAMHWLRIDRYYSGDSESPRIALQPMLCQHCEHAPCEYVCPTHATVHSPDGLNEMVYNRCVGTRFCSNNCPYKVRRFNWFDYSGAIPERERLALNPDVTVRARGVMEKCTYCVQRIRRAEIEARLERRGLREGDVVTACMQACPSEAIVFGQVSDPESAVSRMHRDPRAYAELGQLGTRPRTRYLRRRDESDDGGGRR